MRIDINYTITLEGSDPMGSHLTLEGEKLKDATIEQIVKILKSYSVAVIDETLKKIKFTEKKET